MSRRFLSGFSAIVRDVLSPYIKLLGVFCILVGLMLSSSALGLRLIGAIWLGILGFLFLGVVLSVKTFVCRCCEYEGKEIDKPKEPLPNNVTRLPVRIKYRRI